MDCCSAARWSLWWRSWEKKKPCRKGMADENRSSLPSPVLTRIRFKGSPALRGTLSHTAPLLVVEADHRSIGAGVNARRSIEPQRRKGAEGDCELRIARHFFSACADFSCGERCLALGSDP